MSVKYYKQDIDVQLGDIVEYSSLLFLWKKKRGKVSYLPGISKKNPEMEHNGITWLGVSGEDGTFRGIYIEPESNKVKKGIKFIERSNLVGVITPDEIEEKDW